MNAKLSPPSVKHRPSGVRPGTRLVFGLLLMAGALVQACSDNNGSTGPTFACREKTTSNVKAFNASCTASPAPVTGIANTNQDVNIVVQASPASTEAGRRVSIIVIVTNGNPATVGGGSGQPLPGQTVFIIASAGVVDGPSGTTNAQGLYSTTLLVRCEDAGPITVNASSGGAVSSAGATITVTPASPNTPCS